VRPLDAAVGAELASRLLGSPEQLQRDAAIAAAVAAVRAARLTRPLLDESLDDLVGHRYGGPHRQAVEALESELDERAWAIQSEVVDRHAPHADYTDAFRRARAAGAVKMALDADARTAASEAVYEAAHAVEDRARLGQLLTAALDLVEPGDHEAARDLAGLFWPRFIKVDGYVLVADHFEPDSFAEWREQRPDSRPAVENVINHVHLLDIFGPRAQAEAVGQTGRQIAQAWREALDATLPREDVTVDWDPQERVVTAFTLGSGP
jgi:hypothetical protein